MKKPILARLSGLILALACLFTLAACGSPYLSVPAEGPLEPEDLMGTWKQCSGGSEDSYQAAAIDEDSITIYLFSGKDDAGSLYWSGTFPMPTEAPFAVTSENYAEITKNAYLASNHPTKEITFEDGQLCFEVDEMGASHQICMKKVGDLELTTRKPGGNTAKPDQAPVKGSTLVPGFNEATNRTIDFHGVRFSFPFYFDSRSEDSDENTILCYPEAQGSTASLVLAAEPLDMSLDQFSRVKATMADGLLAEGGKNLTLLDSKEIKMGKFPGWSVRYVDHRGEADLTVLFSFALNPNSQELVYAVLGFDSTDATGYDYAADYDSILRHASSQSLPAPSGDKASGDRPAPQTPDTPDAPDAAEGEDDFLSEYMEFMESYGSNGDSIAEYSDFMAQHADQMDQLEAHADAQPPEQPDIPQTPEELPEAPQETQSDESDLADLAAVQRIDQKNKTLVGMLS